MNGLVIFYILATFAAVRGSVPNENRPQTGDDNALKRFLLRNNRLPYANETVTVPEPEPTVKSWTTCEGCKMLVTELRRIIRDPSEVARMKELLSRVCQLGIMSRYRNECLSMVDNLILVLREIEPILDNPTAVCQELQYCPESNALSPQKRLALLLGYKLVQSIKPSNTNDIPCDECMFAITELKGLIQSASVQAELKQELHKLCRLAGQYETECSALVDQYFELAISEAVQFLNNPRQVCVDIGFCNSESTTAPGRGRSVPMIRIKPAGARMGRVQLRRYESTQASHMEVFLLTAKNIQTRQGINAGCMVCKSAFKTVIDLMSQERVATMVTNDITKMICGVLPENLKAGCTDFMKIYSRALLQLSLSEFTPPEICTAMGVCKIEDLQRIDQLNGTELSAVECEACQVLSQYLSFEFQQPDFQQEVIGTLKRGCLILPGDYANQVRCETFLQTYIPYMLDNVAGSEIPEICPCDNALESYIPAMLNFVADYIGRNIFCVALKMCDHGQTLPVTARAIRQ